MMFGLQHRQVKCLLLSICCCCIGVCLQSAEESPEEKLARLKLELLQAEIAALEAKAANSESVESPEKEDASKGKIANGALVIVQVVNGGGSGFIASIKGRTFFVTNIHVLGIAREANFETAEGKKVELKKVAFVSYDRDLVIVPIDWDGPSLDISDSLAFDGINIDDKIIVMGNSDGVGVATRLEGKINGIGPDELEISAKFVPGNSGSPIVHEDTGLVIGLVSHMKDLSVKTKWTEDSELSEIRRFGFRMDGDIQWQQLPLERVYAQGEAYNRFEDRTEVMAHTIYMLQYERTVMTNYRDHESLGRLFKDFDNDFNWKRGTNSPGNVRKLDRFVDNLRRELYTDQIETAELLTINFFKKRFKSMDSVRENYIDVLNRLDF
jgi:hypothetical protein